MWRYKEQLSTQLAAHGWEIVEVVNVDAWWADDCWRLRSTKESWGLEIVLTFIIDPTWESYNTKSRPLLSAIIATKAIPKTQLTPNPITELDMAKGKFDVKLHEFIKGLNYYRETKP